MRERHREQHIVHPPAGAEEPVRPCRPPAETRATSCAGCPIQTPASPSRARVIGSALAIGMTGYSIGAIMGLAAGSPAPFEIGHAILGGCVFAALLGAGLAAALPRTPARDGGTANVDSNPHRTATGTQPPHRAPAPLEDTLARATLTAQEIMIARLIAGPEPYRIIADQLCLTESTVKFHARNIFRKTHVRNRSEFRIFARAAAQRAQETPARASSAQKNGAAPEEHRPAASR